MQSFDKLVLLSDGQMRHYIVHESVGEQGGSFNLKHTADVGGAADDDDDDGGTWPSRHYDYPSGQYCLDVAVSTVSEPRTMLHAWVCSPEHVIRWTDTDFLLRKIINPVCHGIAMCVLLVIAIVYFVLPTLR